MRKKWSLKKKILVIVPLLLLAVLVGVGVWYVNDYYHSDEIAATYLTTTDVVEVSENDWGYFFDSEGTEDALIFYPGAKVEYTAYAPMMMMIAEKGIDVFLVKMPCNLAILGQNKAQEIMDQYEYENWYLSGHSLGGAMAADFTANHQDEVKGLVLMAAYPTKEITEKEISVLSLYGSEDGVLNLDKVAQGKSLIAGSYLEICMEGANHAGFGNYGEQKGDGIASMTSGLQQQRTANEIASWMSQNQ